MTAPPPGTRSRGKDGTEPPLVLIVDDNARNRKLARDVLLAAGFRTLEAVSGAEGIVLAAGELPDVVLLDLGLPGMGGHEVARVIRRTPGLQTTLLIATTGYGGERERRLTSDAGFDRHLLKPYSPECLERLLAEAAARAQGED